MKQVVFVATFNAASDTSTHKPSEKLEENKKYKVAYVQNGGIVCICLLFSILKCLMVRIINCAFLP